MARTELSISFRSEQNESILQATASAAGKYGFDVVSVYEDLGDQSPMYPLMTLAKHIHGARIGPAGIAVPKYKTMEPVVGDITRLNSISNGNAYLGLVPGAWMESLGIKPATVAHVREAADVSRYLLEKRDDGFKGRNYEVKPGFTVNFSTPQHRIPLLIGAWGEKMAALAGEIADEIKVGGSANPLMVEIIKNRVSRGIEKAGRNSEDVGIVFGAVTVIDNDRETALRIARERAVIYIDVIGEKDVTAMADFPNEIKAIKQAMQRGDTQEALRYLPDELTKRFLFAGTPEDIIRQTEDLFAAGASRVEFGAPHGINQIEGIHLLGQRVLPYFEKKGGNKYER